MNEVKGVRIYWCGSLANDIIVGDSTGLVVIPSERTVKVLQKAKELNEILPYESFHLQTAPITIIITGTPM